MKWVMLSCLLWPAIASAEWTAQLAVKGQIELRVSLVSADVEVNPGAAGQVRARLEGVDCSDGMALTQHGDRVDLVKNGVPFVEGRLIVEVPKGSHVDIEDTSGDVAINAVGGRVRVRAISGDVQVRGASSVELTTVSGDAQLSQIGGEVRAQTVSGDLQVTQSCGPSTQLKFTSTSGDLVWHGDCATGCRLETRTTSGTVKLVPGPSSSFEVTFSSHSGELADELKMETLPAQRGKRGRLGKGDGLVECRTFSGDLALARK
jgi:hypothetical protein